MAEGARFELAVRREPYAGFQNRRSVRFNILQHRHLQQAALKVRTIGAPMRALAPRAGLRPRQSVHQKLQLAVLP